MCCDNLQWPQVFLQTRTNSAFSFPHQLGQGLPDANSRTPTPTWDMHLLQLLDARRSLSSPAVFFFGCCHRGCKNLQGGSEATLQLRKCGGCNLARFVCPSVLCWLVLVIVANGLTIMFGWSLFFPEQHAQMTATGNTHRVSWCVTLSTAGHYPTVPPSPRASRSKYAHSFLNQHALMICFPCLNKLT